MRYLYLLPTMIVTAFVGLGLDSVIGWPGFVIEFFFGVALSVAVLTWADA